MDLESDARRVILRELPVAAADRHLLEAMDTGTLLIEYFTWRHRLVSRRRRRVHRSKALERYLRSATARQRTEVKGVLTEIADGVDLTSRLSTRITDGFRPGLASQPRRDQDLMLNDWGVHHLHLGAAFAEGRFVTRTGDLLYVAFTEQDAYAIGVFTHADWANYAVLNIIADEWPNHGIIHASATGLRLETKVKSPDRKRLREAGVTVLHERRGRVFLPRGGVSTALTALGAAQASNAIMHGIRVVNEEVSRDAAWLWSRLPEDRRPGSPDDCDWQLELQKDRGELLDRSSGHRLQLH